MFRVLPQGGATTLPTITRILHFLTDISYVCTYFRTDIYVCTHFMMDFFYVCAHFMTDLSYVCTHLMMEFPCIFTHVINDFFYIYLPLFFSFSFFSFLCLNFIESTFYVDRHFMEDLHQFYKLSVNPWHRPDINRNGWVGVKHQVTYCQSLATVQTLERCA